MSTTTDNWEHVQKAAQVILGEDIVAFIDECRQGTEPESQLIAVLHKVQAKFGYLGQAQLDSVAQLLQVPSAKVAGVASFYPRFRLQPRDRFMINVCLGTACYVKAPIGSPKADVRTGIRFGETSTDGMFTLEGPLPGHLRPGPGDHGRQRSPRPGHPRPGSPDSREVSRTGPPGEKWWIVDGG